MNLYLDDERPVPAEWVLARTIAEAKAHLSAGAVDRASLDHDLGQCEACGSELGPNNCRHVGTGYDLVKWMAETGNWPREKPTVHSMNPVGAAAMRQMIDRFWGEPA